MHQQNFRVGGIALGVWALALSGLGCNDTEDAVDGDAEPVSFRVDGTLCGDSVSYEAPVGTALTLALTPSGLVQGVLIGDGPLTNMDDSNALSSYAARHDLIASIGLEEPAELQAGSVGSVAAVRVSGKGFGSLELSVLEQKPLLISEYRPGTRIAGSVSYGVDWFSNSYPERDGTECQEGEVTLSFHGSYTAYDGQDDCFSPTQNLDRFANEFMLGCACDPSVDQAVCVTICEDSRQQSGHDASCDGMAIALFCTGEQWTWGYDGPCR
jgi:hypothetical protein